MTSGAVSIASTFALYDAVVRKLLAALGLARVVARAVAAVVAAAPEANAIEKERRTDAGSTVSLTADAGTPALLATCAISSMRTFADRSATVPATMTDIVTVAMEGTSGALGGGDGNSGGEGEGGGGEGGGGEGIGGEA